MEYSLKKSLGQHFLKDEAICIQIAQAIEAALQQFQLTNLLEVGPGAGAITKHLINIPNCHFKAVELDEEKVAYLNKNFPSLNGKIISEDFLHTVPPFDEPFMVVGNYPYNISTQILFKIIDWKDVVPVSIGMFQKEVAIRAAAKPGKKDYGVLSVLLQAFYEVTYLFDIPPESFNPPPKVMSGIIKLQRKTEELNYTSHKKFILLVKTSFNQRRKTLRNATRALFEPTVLTNEIFNKRAEQLSLQDFANLTHQMR